MKTHVTLLASALFLTSCGAQAQTPAQPQSGMQPGSVTPQASPATCYPNEVPMRVAFKESFRYGNSLRDGTHRYLLIEGCQNGDRVRGTATTGVEDDQYFQNPVPVPHPEWTRTRDFLGSYQDQRNVAHGTVGDIHSDDGNIKAYGNFYYNRDIFYKVDAMEIPASVIR